MAKRLSDDTVAGFSGDDGTICTQIGCFLIGTRRSDCSVNKFGMKMVNGIRGGFEKVDAGVFG